MSSKKVLDAAYEIFSREGYDGASLSLIAKEVGITKSTIYSHFKSKEEVFDCVLNKQFAEVCKALDNIINEIEVNLENNTTKQVLYNYYINTINYIGRKESSARFWGYVMYFPILSMKKKINLMLEPVNQRNQRIQRMIFDSGLKQKEIKDIGIESLLFSFSVLINGTIGEIIYYDLVDVDSSKLESNFNIYWDGINNG